jgi:hypothetical protein
MAPQPMENRGKALGRSCRCVCKYIPNCPLGKSRNTVSPQTDGYPLAALS